MYVLQREAQGYEPLLAHHIFRQCLFYLRQGRPERIGLQRAHHLAGDGRLELLGAGIYPRYAAFGDRTERSVDLRMYEIDLLPEYLRLPEEDEHAAGDELPVGPPESLEEHELHSAAGVFHYHAQPLAGARAEPSVGIGCDYGTALPVEGARDHAGAYLYVCELGSRFGYGSYAAAVDVAERIELKQVAHRLDAELRGEQLRSPGSYTAEVLYA